MPRPPRPPIDEGTDALKVPAAEDAWNGRDPAVVALAYTPESEWRNRAAFLRGRDAIVAFLTRKWAHGRDYRLIKELWATAGDRIAVRFASEWHDGTGWWFRSYGDEDRAFDDDGLMRRRIASVNDRSIGEEDRLFRWPSGRRPDDHSSLSAIGL